jgi:hypothetical protein
VTLSRKSISLFPESREDYAGRNTILDGPSKIVPNAVVGRHDFIQRCRHGAASKNISRASEYESPSYGLDR